MYMYMYMYINKHVHVHVNVNVYQIFDPRVTSEGRLPANGRRLSHLRDIQQQPPQRLRII